MVETGLICRLKFTLGWSSCFGEKALLSVDGNIREKRTLGKNVHVRLNSERVGVVGRGMHFWCFACAEGGH